MKNVDINLGIIHNDQYYDSIIKIVSVIFGCARRQLNLYGSILSSARSWRNIYFASNFAQHWRSTDKVCGAGKLKFKDGHLERSFGDKRSFNIKLWWEGSKFHLKYSLVVYNLKICLFLKTTFYFNQPTTCNDHYTVSCNIVKWI